MDEFIDRLAEALRKEFPFLDGPNTGKDAFRIAATGIVKKMGLEPMRFSVTPTLNKEPTTWDVYVLPEKGDPT